MMTNNTNPLTPGEVPEIPQEMPVPGKMPEAEPQPVAPESPSFPTEAPGDLLDEGPFQPEIPSEVPPSET